MTDGVLALTTEWHPAPQATWMPRGAVALFKQECPPGARVRWVGAQELDSTAASARAFLPCDVLGSHRVRAIMQLADGTTVSDECILDVRDVRIQDIAFGAVRAEAETIGDPMQYFMGEKAHDSVAELHDFGNGLYVTSVNREVRLRAEVHPAGFAPLVEWRVDGVLAAKTGETHDVRFLSPGVRAITAGPPDRRAGAATLILYRTFVESPPAWESLDLSSPLLFTATTEPPGFESMVTWIAATKYGSVTPAIGQGPSFLAGFAQAFGPAGSAWVGVKADNAVAAQDGGMEFLVTAFVQQPPKVKIGRMKIKENDGNGSINAAFTLNNGFEYLCEWYNFRWINVVTSIAPGFDLDADGNLDDGVDGNNDGDALDPGESLVGELPAVDPAPLGYGNGDDDKPFYWADAELGANAWTRPFSDGRADPLGDWDTITFKTYLVVENLTDPGIGAMSLCVLAGFEWKSVIPANGGNGTETFTGFISDPGAADIACINMALGTVTPAGAADPNDPSFPGWSATNVYVLSACP